MMSPLHPPFHLGAEGIIISIYPSIYLSILFYDTTLIDLLMQIFVREKQTDRESQRGRENRQ